ncbi:MAG: phage antirepressor KilAC domain-containing protein, partial [Pseudomonadota bacterium]
GMQPKKFIQWLSAERWIFKRGGKGPWIAYQDRIQLGYMSTREHRWTTEYGEERSSAQALITPKGMTKLASMLAKQEKAA